MLTHDYSGHCASPCVQQECVVGAPHFFVVRSQRVKAQARTKYIIQSPNITVFWSTLQTSHFQIPPPSGPKLSKNMHCTMIFVSN